MFSTTSDGWDAWLKASPAHQAIMGMDLIPQSVSTIKPLTWEQACAAGDYNQYATALAQNLVSYGAGSVVIRLGVEANGGWEADFVGSTTQEMRDWAKCYDNEVTAMRAVAGTHFLFVWNPNVCTVDLPLSDLVSGELLCGHHGNRRIRRGLRESEDGVPGRLGHLLLGQRQRRQAYPNSPVSTI